MPSCATAAPPWWGNNSPVAQLRGPTQWGALCAYKRFLRRRKPWRRGNSFAPSMIKSGSPRGLTRGARPLRRRGGGIIPIPRKDAVRIHGVLFCGLGGAASGGAAFFPKKAAGKKGLGRGISISPAPTPHPLKRPKRGNCGPPSLETPPGCSVESVPTAGPYFVTSPPYRRISRRRSWRRKPDTDRHSCRASARAVFFSDSVTRTVMD